MAKFLKEKTCTAVNSAGFGFVGFYDQKISTAPVSADVNLQNISRGT